MPYAIAQSGVIPGVFYLVVLGGMVLLLHLMFGEIALRTTEKHRLIGYASVYVGSWAKILITISTFVGVVGALLAYIILAGDFLQIIVSSLIPISSFGLSILFWLFGSFFIIRGIQSIAKMELLMNVVLFVVVGIIFVFALPHVAIEHYTMFNPSFMFLPYGVVLFAFMGLSAIPEIAELFKRKKEKRNLDNVIIWASVICGALYALFTFFVIGVSGSETSKDALRGLAPFLGDRIVLLGAIFGLVAISASFLVVGNYLKNSLRHDYHVSSRVSVLIVVFLPILLFAMGLRDFILILGVVGAAVGALEGIVITLAFRRAKNMGDRKPEYSLRIPGYIFFIVGGVVCIGFIFEVFELWTHF